MGFQYWPNNITELVEQTEPGSDQEMSGLSHSQGAIEAENFNSTNHTNWLILKLYATKCTIIFQL